MARFSDDELDEIRRNTDIVTLIESYGTKLKERPTPNEYIGCCPLHDDETPSLFVNRAKGVWQCKGACGCGGDCFRWVMKAEKVSFVASVELFKANAVGRVAGNGTKAAYVRRLENPTTSTAEDHEVLSQVAEFYLSRLKEIKSAMEDLTSRGLDNAEALGVMKKATGHEALRGCITFWISGFRKVTCSYGNQGLTEELFQAFIKSGVEVCWIARDNDENSNPLALQLAARLMAQGIKCMRMIFPEKTKDANEFALKIKDGNGTSHGSLSMLMRNAEGLRQRRQVKGGKSKGALHSTHFVMRPNRKV